MCEKCDSHQIPSEFEYDEMKPILFVRDKDNALEIHIPWKRDLDNSIMVTACAVGINYCPWCGRDLEDKNNGNN